MGRESSIEICFIYFLFLLGGGGGVGPSGVALGFGRCVQGLGFRLEFLVRFKEKGPL